MNAEEIIRAGLDDLGAAVKPSVPDPAGVRRSANRTTRLRAGVAVGLAAAITAAILVGVNQLGDHSDAIQPAEHQEHGDTVAEPVSGAVWSVRDRIYDDERAYVAAGRLTSNLAPTISGVAYGVAGDDILYQPRNGEAYRIGQHAPLGPVADPTSGLVAWFDGQGGGTELVIYDLETGHEVQRGDVRELTVTSPETMVGRSQPPIQWLGHNERGGVTVFFAADGGTWRYDTDLTDPQRLRQVASTSVDASLDLLASLEPNRSTMNFVRNDRRVVVSSYRPLEPDGGLSHDGQFYAGYSHGALVLVDTATGQSREADLPQDVIPFGVTWSRDVVMFYAPDLGGGKTGSIYACPVDTFRCQVVDHTENAFEAVLPAF